LAGDDAAVDATSPEKMQSQSDRRCTMAVLIHHISVLVALALASAAFRSTAAQGNSTQSIVFHQEHEDFFQLLRTRGVLPAQG
jgi:hypothetical protein